MMKSVTQELPPARLYVVDRDPDVAETVGRFGAARGVDVEWFRHTEDFAQAFVGDRPSGLVIGIEVPGETEIAVLDALGAQRDPVGVIALGTSPRISLVVRAIKAGVLNFMEKPSVEADLVEHMSAALEQGIRKFASRCRWSDFEKRLAELTDRQREILEHIVLGKANKVIAFDLGISERTVEVHRYRLLRRMRVSSAVELARLTGGFQVARGRDAA